MHTTRLIATLVLVALALPVAAFAGGDDPPEQRPDAQPARAVGG